MTSYKGIFEVGSLPPIHGKITISPRNRDTVGLEHGLFKETRSQNGKHLERVRFYGSMGKVSRCLALTLFYRLMIFPFRSGRRKECTMVHQPVNIFFLKNLRYRPVRQSSKRSMICGNLVSHPWQSTTMILERTKRRTSVGCAIPAL